MVDPDALPRAFAAAYGRPPHCVVRAPGRVNLIGEHTDYNDGFVMPMAIDRFTWIAAAARDDEEIVVRSRERGDAGTWRRYVDGVTAILRETGDLPGADLLIASDVPIGAGLSSSAALEVSFGFALLTLAGRPVDRTQLARACQRAEHEYAGTRCGIMDQMIATHAREHHLMKLDTRSLRQEQVPLPSAIRVVVANTMVAHELARNAYNDRRADCEEGVRVLARRCPNVRALRDATLEHLAADPDLSPRVIRRCRHVITENARVEAAAAALRCGDFTTFGRLMSESHASLRDDYEVSCAELDTMAGIVGSVRGVYGARMTGGGFGGCVVGIVDRAVDAECVRQTIAAQYQRATGLSPDIWFCSAAGGVR